MRGTELPGQIAGAVGKAASSPEKDDAAVVELQGSVGSNPLNLNVAPPQTTSASTWHDFTQLSTPPPSPAPSPAITHNNVNHKRISGPGLVSQMFTRQSGLPRGASNASNTGNGSDADLEKGENELSGINTSGSSSSANNKISGSAGKSDSDLASRLADALSSHYDPGAGGPKSDNGRGSWSHSFHTVRNSAPFFLRLLVNKEPQSQLAFILTLFPSDIPSYLRTPRTT